MSWTIARDSGEVVAPSWRRERVHSEGAGERKHPGLVDSRPRRSSTGGLPQETTMKLIPYLMFTKGQCREAFDFYAQALRGKVISVSTYGDMPGPAEHTPAGNLARVANAHLMAAGASIMGSDNVMGGAAADSDEG